MSKTLFLDTNVLLDFFWERHPFSAEAELLFKLREDNRVEFFVSSLTLANVAYFADKAKKDPFKIISVLLEWVQVVELDRSQFIQTLSSRFKDFEDGLQYFSALRARGVDVIITRNKKDFGASQLLVQTPTEFLKSFEL